MPETLVDWLSADDVELDAESASMVQLPAGPRLMVLAHRAGACTFLDTENRCRVYAARPLDCRLYPFVLERGPDRQVTRLSLFDPAGCGDRSSERANLDELVHADAERWTELARYRELVARWNRLARHRRRLRHPAHGVREFMAFLGLD